MWTGSNMIKAKEVLSLCENKSFEVSLKELTNHLGLAVSGSSREDRYYFYSYFSLKNQPSSDIPKINNDFYQEYESKLRLPLKSLEDFCGSKFVVSGYMGLTNFETRFNVDDKRIKTVVSISFPHSNQAVMCVMVDLLSSPQESIENLVNSMPNDKKQRLMSSIVNTFIGYNKLVNNFKDKPVKKTNADW
jgi:hypothetical protein